MAQLGARFDGIEEVAGSNPARSTKRACCPEGRRFHPRGETFLKLRNSLLAAGLCLLLAPSLSAQQPPQQPQQSSEQVAAEQQQALQTIRRTANPAELAPLIEQFLQKYPDTPETWELILRASDAYRQINNYPKAIEYGEKAIEMKPQDPSGRVVLANLLADSSRSGLDAPQKLARAKKYAQEALALLPPYLETWSLPPPMTAEELDTRKKLFEAQLRSTLGYIYLLGNEYALAETELVKATDLGQAQPNQMDYLLLGRAYFFQDKLEPAVAAFRKAVAMGGSLYETAQRHLQLAEQALAKRPPASPAPAETKPPAPKPQESPVQP